MNTPPSHLVMKRRAKFRRTVGIWVFGLVASAVIGFAIGAYFQRDLTALVVARSAHDRRLGHLYKRPPKLVLSNALKKATHG